MYTNIFIFLFVINCTTTFCSNDVSSIFFWNFWNFELLGSGNVSKIENVDIPTQVTTLYEGGVLSLGWVHGRDQHDQEATSSKNQDGGGSGKNGQTEGKESSKGASSGSR